MLAGRKSRAGTAAAVSAKVLPGNEEKDARPTNEHGHLLVSLDEAPIPE
jgi:hypothetical protein